MVFIFRRCWEEENSRQFVWTAAAEEEEGSREITLPPPTLAPPHKTTRRPPLPPTPLSLLGRASSVWEKKGRKCH